jgi:SAM-dependent methyltransferase
VDVGCGEGRLARDVKELGHTILALDRSPAMVLHARTADQVLDVRTADAAALPLADGEADLIISFMSPSMLRWRRIPLFLHIRAVAGAGSTA